MKSITKPRTFKTAMVGVNAEEFGQQTSPQCEQVGLISDPARARPHTLKTSTNCEY